MKIIVLTANIGGIDTDNAFPAQDIACDFRSITDFNLGFPMEELSSRMKAKFFKLQSHRLFPGYDAYVWMDSSFQIVNKSFASYMTGKLEHCDIAITKHPDRDCIYDEADFVMRGIMNGDMYLVKRYKIDNIQRERNYYMSLSFPAKKGLFACGLFARKNNEATNGLFDRWWESCLKWSSFDQLSFPFLLHNTPEVRVHPLVFENYLSNAFYHYKGHTKIV